MAVAGIVIGGLVVGFLIGRWWALALAFLWPLLVAIFWDADGDMNLAGGVFLTLLITVPIQAAGIAAGVLLRRRTAARA